MTTRQYYHGIGASPTQNAAECVKYTIPNQAIDLGLLPKNESVLWQYDPEYGLPVTTTADNFGKMYGTYDEPELRKVRNGTTTVPKTYTEDAHDGGHAKVNFTKEDTLIFFAPEEKIANDFSRLYVGTFDDYQRLARGCTQITWCKSYERPVFVPSQQKHVREICIDQPGKIPFRTTRAATEGWIQAEKLLDNTPTFPDQNSWRRPADDD